MRLRLELTKGGGAQIYGEDCILAALRYATTWDGTKKWDGRYTSMRWLRGENCFKLRRVWVSIQTPCLCPWSDDNPSGVSVARLFPRRWRTCVHVGASVDDPDNSGSVLSTRVFRSCLSFIQNSITISAPNIFWGHRRSRNCMLFIVLSIESSLSIEHFIVHGIMRER